MNAVIMVNYMMITFAIGVINMNCVIYKGCKD